MVLYVFLLVNYAAQDGLRYWRGVSLREFFASGIFVIIVVAFFFDCSRSMLEKLWSMNSLTVGVFVIVERLSLYLIATD